MLRKKEARCIQYVLHLVPLPLPSIFDGMQLDRVSCETARQNERSRALAQHSFFLVRFVLRVERQPSNDIARISGKNLTDQFNIDGERLYRPGPALPKKCQTGNKGMYTLKSLFFYI